MKKNALYKYVQEQQGTKPLLPVLPGGALRLTRSVYWDKRLVNGHRLKHQRFQRLQRNHRRVFILNGHRFIAAVYRFQTKLRRVSCRYFEILRQIQIVGLWFIRWVAQTENGFVFAPGCPAVHGKRRWVAANPVGINQHAGIFLRPFCSLRQRIPLHLVQHGRGNIQLLQLGAGREVAPDLIGKVFVRLHLL